MIILDDVSKSFDNGKTLSVNHVSLTIEEGETLVLLGSSGCGKTSLLRMINRLITPSSGNLTIDGENIQSIDQVTLRRTIGYVIQGVGLFPHLTIADNIAIVLRLLKKDKKAQREKAVEMLEFVNLAPDQYADKFPDELSGGQQQRVGVARALANAPNILLMDEPFGALDAITRGDLQEDFIKLKKRLNKTVVFVTHDVFEALRLGDRIAIMDKGRLLQIDTPDQIINQPVNNFVRDLFAKSVAQVAHYDEHKE